MGTSAESLALRELITAIYEARKLCPRDDATHGLLTEALRSAEASLNRAEGRRAARNMQGGTGPDVMARYGTRKGYGRRSGG